MNELEAELAELKSQKPVTWRCRIAGSDHWAYFPNKSCRFCEPLYANPVEQAELAALKSATVVMPEDKAIEQVMADVCEENKEFEIGIPYYALCVHEFKEVLARLNRSKTNEQ